MNIFHILGVLIKFVSYIYLNILQLLAMNAELTIILTKMKRVNSASYLKDYMKKLVREKKPNHDINFIYEFKIYFYFLSECLCPWLQTCELEDFF